MSGFDVLRSDPWTVPGRWLRGNLHTHTNLSDGRWSVADCVGWYRSHGYDFLALTDHFAIADAAAFQTPDFLPIPGVEVDGTDPRFGTYHLVGLGLSAVPPRDACRTMPAAIAALHAAGALVAVAHPYWSGQTATQLLVADGYFAVEVYNATCEGGWAKGLAGSIWDELLTAGRPVWGLATDDCHNAAERRDRGEAWVMLKADSLTQESVLGALESGQFYATNGPTIEQTRLSGSTVVVNCSPCVAISLICDRWLGGRVNAPPGQTITEARFPLSPGARYWRVECLDASGHRAWSQPRATSAEH